MNNNFFELFKFVLGNFRFSLTFYQLNVEPIYSIKLPLTKVIQKLFINLHKME